MLSRLGEGLTGAPAIAVHGGAGGAARGNLAGEVRRAILDALKVGLEKGRDGSALDMVVEAVMSLEDSGVLNAGLGSVLDISGCVSMDAGVMYSKLGRAGAVAYVKYPRNPVLLARHVMELTDHIMIVGDAADALAERLGLKKHPGPSPRSKKLYEEAMGKVLKGETPQRLYAKSIRFWTKMLGVGDTVGAVAVDKEGELAAAVSTGGILLKLPGRVGDSPIVGAGFYANRLGAASATGVGEFIMLNHLSFRVVEYLARGVGLQVAVETAIRELTNMYGEGTAGVIAIDRDGRVHGAHNTSTMPWGYASQDKTRTYGIPGDDSQCLG